MLKCGEGRAEKKETLTEARVSVKTKERPSLKL
jgi:hypothetical protein